MNQTTGALPRKGLLASAMLGAGLMLAGCEGDRGPMGVAGGMGAPGAAGTPGAAGANAGDPPAAACTAVTPLPAGLPASAVALTASGKLVRFTPGSSAGGNVLNVLGLAAGEALVGIDYRPSDRALIGVVKDGTAGSLVRINEATGEITRLVATGATPLTLNGNRYGVDFNPIPGALRIVGDNEENWRLTFSGANLSSYAVIADTALAPMGNVVGAAYTNSFAGTPLTTLYDLDSTANTLLTQGGIDSATNPNSGALVTVGALGVDFSDAADLDIDGVTGAALAVLNLPGAVSTGLYSIDLGTGLASCIGTVPAPQGDLSLGFAIPTPDPAIAYGLTTGDGLVTFTPNAAGVALATGPVALTGLASVTEIPVGMDIRPRTGALTLVTRDPANATTPNLGRLYSVDPVSGAATLIPANSTVLDFDDAATDFGVDFNPVPNALRVVNNAGQNFRLTFPAGTAGYNVTVDGAVNPAGNSNAAAYTNSFDGTTATRLYIVDTTTGELKFQNPPNDGTQSVVGALGVMVGDANSGFDIVGGAGVTGAGVNIGNAVSFAALTIGGSSNLYRINLQTGAATQVGSGPITAGAPVSLKALAVRVRK